MSAQAVIDGPEFARNGGTQHGIIAVAELHRLSDLLYDNAGNIEYRLSGELNAENKPVLHLRISGMLRLTCQRCLGLLTDPLDLQRDLALVIGEAEFSQIADESEAVDSILASRAMNIAELVEDEIILSLPLAPKHAEGECGGMGKGATQATSPFAALAALKKV